MMRSVVVSIWISLRRLRITPQRIYFDNVFADRPVPGTHEARRRRLDVRAQVLIYAVLR